MKNILNSRKGFTLIEMLIVVAIIGILASIVIVGLGPAQKRGRDARRIADMRETQTALELFYTKNGHYPGVAVAGPDEDAACAQAQTSWATLTTCLKGSKLGVNNVPNDPTSGKTYLYNSDGTTYVLGATLDDVSNPAFNNAITVNPVAGGTIACGTPIYCLSL